ncbi:MAG: FAD-dependent thymidylate synthase [Dehalococcoidia bacterium]|nr:MAG: FAD-dependent thymidylate synthase [Dehalococcoidia bacterium]
MSDGYDVEVTLLAITPDAERLIESAGRLCWNTQDKTGTVPDRIQAWLEIGHESMIEHACATFSIRGSRAMTHELVRHRIASYSQRSQRYVAENDESYVLPPEVASSEAAAETYRGAMSAAWDAYRKLQEQGLKPQIARYVLPNACYTEIICTWNFRELRHIISLRATPRALPEIREVAVRLRDIMKAAAPQVFADR